jgi:methionyl-tRNA formyltransferase
MSVVLFANNRVGWRIAELLAAEIIAVVLHPPERRRFGDEIVAAAGVSPDRVFDASHLSGDEVHQALQDLAPTFGVSALFGYLLRPKTIALFPGGCVNLHPSLLPWNRGAHPNVWSIVDRTPAGVTLHHVDPGVDTGDIIAQRTVPVDPVDTGATLYQRLEAACVDLFADTWPAIRAGTARRAQQPADAGSTHRARDLARIDEIELDRAYSGRELIDILRARTFPPYPGAYFRADGRKVHLRVELEYGAADDDGR